MRIKEAWGAQRRRRDLCVVVAGAVLAAALAVASAPVAPPAAADDANCSMYDAPIYGNEVLRPGRTLRIPAGVRYKIIDDNTGPTQYFLNVGITGALVRTTGGSHTGDTWFQRDEWGWYDAPAVDSDVRMTVADNNGNPLTESQLNGGYVIAGIELDAPASTCAEISRALREDRLGGVDSDGEAGDPVSTSIGNLVYSSPLETSAPGLVPTYNSLDDWAVGGPLGPIGVFGGAWASILDARLKLDGAGAASGAMRVRFPTGRMGTFAAASATSWTPPSRFELTSVTKSGANYLFKFTTGATWTFDAAGYLVSTLEPSGESTTITRDANEMPTKFSTGASGSATWSWQLVDTGTDGRLDRIVGPYAGSLTAPPAGTPTIAVTYDAQKRLTGWSAPYTTTTSPGGETYAYGTGLQLTSIVRARGGGLAAVPVMVNTFDGQNRVRTQTNAEGEVDTYSYAVSASGSTTTVDHANGAAVETVTYQHDTAGRLVSVIDPYAASTASTWDDDRPTSMAARRGGKATVGYDATGRATSLGLADPATSGTQAGSVTLSYCSGDTRPIDVTDAAGIVTRYWWTTGSSPTPCDVGRTVPAKITHAYGTSAAWDTVVTSTNGLVTQTVDAAGDDNVTTTYNWDPATRLLMSTVDYPNGTGQPGRKTYYGYDSSGRLAQRRDAAGVETWWYYDAAGRLQSQYGPAAVPRTCGATTCSFGSIAPSGPIEMWSYNLDGSPRTHTYPNSWFSSTSTTYPAGGGRVVAVTERSHGDTASTIVATTTTSTYDKFDRLTQQTVGNPSVASSLASTTYTYDPLGRLKTTSQVTGSTSPALVRSFAYDADGNRTVTAYGSDPTDTTKQATRQRFDLRGRLVEEWGPTGDTSAPSSVTGGGAATAVQAHRTWTYDNADRLVAETTGDGVERRQTFRRYDAAGRLHFVIVDRDGDGVVSSGSTGGPTDPDDGVTEYRYTAAGRLKATIASPVDVTSYDWTSGDQSLKRTTTYSYDQAGQDTSIVDARGKTTTQTFTPRGEVLRITKPGGYWSENTYDAAGRVTNVRNPSPTGSGTVDRTTTYDASGWVTAQTDQYATGTANPPATTFAYWNDGLLRWSKSARGTADDVVNYYYDARGNRTTRVSKTQASTSGTVHDVTESWSYDRADRLTAAKRPGETTGTTYTYDALTGRQATQTRPSGRVDTTTYWNDGSVRSVTSTKPADGNGPAGTYRSCTWHDTAGNTTVTLADDVTNPTPCTGGKATTQTWDRTGKQTQVRYPDTPNTPSTQDEVYNTTWDLNGLPRTFTYSDGTVHQFLHDKLGRLTTSAVVWSGGGGFPIAGVSYDDNGNRTAETVNWTEGSRSWTYPANGAPNPTSYTQTIPGGNRTTTLAWRADGRLAGDTTGSSARTYSYDAAGQLTGRADSTGPDFTYSYGPRGLRLSQTVDSTSTSYGYDDKAQLTSTTTGAATTSLAYDADGRRTSITAPSSTQVTQWDARGLPATITSTAGGSSVVEARTYDPDRRLTTTSLSPSSGSPTSWSYVWDPTRPSAVPLQTRVNDTVYSRSNYGLEFVGMQFSTSGSATFLAFDSFRSVVPSTSNPGASSDYDAFGNPSTYTSAQYAYRSEIMQYSLLHLRNRDYDPALGTFTSPDPLDGVAGTPTETNPYHYADNDPANKTDPLGLSPNDCDTLNQNDYLYQAIYGSHPGLSCDEVGKQWAADGAGCAGETFFPGIFPYVARGVRALVGKTGTGYEHGTTACTLGRVWSTGIQAGAAAYSAIDLIPTGSTSSIAASTSDELVDISSSSRRTHILYGDSTGGGHLWPGAPGKTPFPQSWSGDMIMHAISDIATDPVAWQSRGVQGSRVVLTGTRGGVDIRVIVDGRTGEIITGYPTNLPRNP